MLEKTDNILDNNLILR